MIDGFVPLTPEKFEEIKHKALSRYGGPWRVTVWRNGKAVAHKDFMYETLADAWAQKTRDAAKILKETGIFVKKECRNGQ